MEDAILLVDDNEAIVEIMSLYVESFGENEIFTAFSGNEAIAVLEKNPQIGLIISDFNMPDGTGGDLYKYVQAKLPNIPFVLQTAEPLELLDEFTEFPSHKKEFFLQKPFTNAQVNEVLETIYADENGDAPKPPEYVRVSISTFHKYSQAPVDAFIKLSEKKFVKFHHHDDDLDVETIVKYENKGLKYFYICKSDYQSFINACQVELELKLLSPNLSAEEVAEARFDSSENIHIGIQKLGISEDSVDQAEKIAAHVINKMPKKKDMAALLKEMQNGKSYLSRLSLLTGNIAVAIAERIEWADAKMYEKLMMASMFMDIYWLDEKNADQAETEFSQITYNDLNQVAKLDQTLQDLIFFHSQRSAQMFDEVKSDGDIYNLIVDHHERPSGRGFPKKSLDDQISSMAAIFVLAHEFSHRIITAGKLDLEIFSQIKIDMITEFSKGKFREPMKSFIQIFS